MGHNSFGLDGSTGRRWSISSGLLPYALEFPRVRVINHNAAVPIPVADEHLIRFGVDANARRSPKDFGRVAAGLAAFANGHHKFAIPRELENLVVVRKARGVVSRSVRVPQDPHR